MASSDWAMSESSLSPDIKYGFRVIFDRGILLVPILGSRVSNVGWMALCLYKACTETVCFASGLGIV